MACPFLYWERIIMGRKEAENVYALRGTQIHQALSEYIDHLVRTKQPSDYQQFDRILHDLAPGDDATEILEAMRESLVLDPERVLASELYLALDADLRPIDESPAGYENHSELIRQEQADGTIAFEGTLDLVLAESSKVAEIWDWKSFYQVIDADTFQSKLYPLLLFKHYPGLEVVRFKLQFVRYGVAREVTYTRDQVPQLERLARGERLRQIALHNEATMPRAFEGYGPMPGSHCAYCPKLNDGSCPIAALNPYNALDPADRVRFGVWIAQAKKENDRVLKDLVSAGGPIAVTDGNGAKYEAGFQLKEKSIYPMTCFSVIAANDPELVRKLTISGLSTPLKAKKRAPLAALLAPLKATQSATRFGIRGVDDDEDEGQ